MLQNNYNTVFLVSKKFFHPHPKFIIIIVHERRERKRENYSKNGDDDDERKKKDSHFRTFPSNLHKFLFGLENNLLAVLLFLYFLCCVGTDGERGARIGKSGSPGSDYLEDFGL